MALFNKLFNTRGRNTHSKGQNNASEKLFAFSKDQVRLLLFRECDFRGRKLLFDSSSVKKVPITTSKPTPKPNESIQPESKDTEKFIEISDGYGYIYAQPSADFSQLAEMVFGSVAMSFRGTYFKIHNLDTPNRIMFTQVFPSPHHRNHASSRYVKPSTHSLEHSNNKLGESRASSTPSMGDNLTSQSAVLVCRKLQNCTPMDLPIGTQLSTSNPSTVGDSGYGPENSYSNVSSGPPSIGSTDNGSNTSTVSFSSSGLYNRWLRRTSTSLENSTLSMPSSGFIEEFHSKPHHRPSKLGLSLIVQLTPGQEEELGQFFMDHVVLLETMLWRARGVIEVAYVKSHNFVSHMVEMANLTTQYLVSLLSDSYISMNLWLLFSKSCDNFNSISAFSAALSDSMSSSVSSKVTGGEKNGHIQNSDGVSSKQIDNTLFNISRLWRPEWDLFHTKSFFSQQGSLTAETFVKDFCELLETIDIKDTNFFMSTLVTAVLTHHLGWVNTCIPSTSNGNLHVETRSPFNPLWGELSDLYGALGHPTKMAQTFITGINRKDIVSKILTSLTYFIRCCDVDRKTPVRVDVEEENKVVDMICQKYSCIPKDNYKKYEDHLKEIMMRNGDFLRPLKKVVKGATPNIEVSKFSKNESKMTKESYLKKSSGLTKIQTVNNLSDILKNNDLTTLCASVDESSNCLYSSTNHASGNKNFLDADLHSQKPDMYRTSGDISKNKILTTPSNNAVLCHLKDDFATRQRIDYSMKMHMEKQMKTSDFNGAESPPGVLFVLGDDEKLVGLKKPKAESLPSEGKISIQRPSFLDLTKTFCENNDFQDSDFVKNQSENLIKPSTSWTSLNASKDEVIRSSVSDGDVMYSRSQSVPPEDRKLKELNEDAKIKSKYRYSGVRFNLQQYPQILSNYMKSKNLEISNLQIGEKGFKINELSSISDVITSKYPELENDFEEGEPLQTPSNASELEFTSDIFVAPPIKEHAKETSVEALNTTFIKQHMPNTVIKEVDGEKKSMRSVKSGCDGYNKTDSNKMKVANLPMPKSIYTRPAVQPVRYTSSLMRAANDMYMPDMVLQAPTLPKQEWVSRLKNDLALASQHSPIDQPVEEAVAVIANTDTWEVQLMSSHTFVIDKGSSGVRVGMSQVVANMLETFLHMWKLNVPPHYCLMHIEQTLQQFCVRSKALAELLLASEFCSMEQLTSTLHLEVNDVPLLLAVASTHSPQVTQKYGLSFQ